MCRTNQYYNQSKSRYSKTDARWQQRAAWAKSIPGRILMTSDTSQYGGRTDIVVIFAAKLSVFSQIAQFLLNHTLKEYPDLKFNFFCGYLMTFQIKHGR